MSSKSAAHRKLMLEKRDMLAGVRDEPVGTTVCPGKHQYCIGPGCGFYDPVGEQCGVKSIGIAASLLMSSGPFVDDESDQSEGG